LNFRVENLDVSLIPYHKSQNEKVCDASIHTYFQTYTFENSIYKPCH